MSTIQTATEALVRLTKQVIHPDTVLVFTDDLFEVQRTPSVILQGPKLTEDRFRRSQTRLFEKNIPVSASRNVFFQGSTILISIWW